MGKVYIYIIALFFLACKPAIKKDKLDVTDGAFSAGRADFRSYIALGGSLAAGFQDGELYKTGQEGSYPAILQSAFGSVGANKKSLGLMYDEYGFGNRKRILYQNDCRGERDLIIGTYKNTPDSRNKNNLSGQGPYLNYAFPNVLLTDITNANLRNTNVFYERIANGQNSILQEVLAVDASFFTISLDNDVLLTAMTGLVVNGNTLPSVNTFRNQLRSLLQALTTHGAKGVISTFPHLKDYPFFTTVPYNALDITQEQADVLNALYLLNPTISFKAGPNPFVILDGAIERQLRAQEFVLLSIDVDSIKCGNYGSVLPFSDADVLTENEINTIEARIDAYNAVIISLADEYDLAVVALDGLYQNLSNGGVLVEGFNHSNIFVEGLFFSYDGINPSPRGSAIIANKFVQAINVKYDASLPLVSPLQYRTVLIP